MAKRPYAFWLTYFTERRYHPREQAEQCEHQSDCGYDCKQPQDYFALAAGNNRSRLDQSWRNQLQLSHSAAV